MDFDCLKLELGESIVLCLGVAENELRQSDEIAFLLAHIFGVGA